MTMVQARRGRFIPSNVDSQDVSLACAYYSDYTLSGSLPRSDQVFPAGKCRASLMGIESLVGAWGYHSWRV